uniref:CCHC-type domain-containing protein n=1 Tax=Tanacetum cinerariifolium TaxID=118510 RepID=A0A699IH55_TANCI|nr:hypothetical protein [Tanacetum cinerariifolium]
MSRDVLTVGSTMRIPLLYRGEYSQWIERFMNYLKEQMDGEAMINCIKNGDQPLPRVTQWKQYATMMRQNKNLMDINIDALYNILKQNQGDVNDAMGLKKKTVVVTSDPLALLAEKTKESKRKEKSANKKQKYVKSDDKKVEKKDDEKNQDMSKVKCYNYKKEGHFAKDCKKFKVKDYEYYKTKMLLAKKDKEEQVLLAEDHAWMESSSDSDQEINANMVSYYLSESKSESEYETSKYYDNTTTYGLFVNDNDDQEIFHDCENFLENLIESQIDHNESAVDHNDYERIDKLIRKFNKKIAKCLKRIEKANQQNKDFKNQNKDLQDKYDVLKNQATTFEMQNNKLNEQMKVLIKKNDVLLAQTNVLKDQLQVKHVVIDTHFECQEKYAKLEAERYEYMIRYSAYFDNDKQHRKQIADQEVLYDKMNVQLVELDKHDLEIEKCLECLNDCENKLHKMGQTNQTVHMIMPSKDKMYNGQKGIGFENPSYFCKTKDLRPTLYDERVINLGYTPMFLTHSDEALSDNYFQEIINPDFEKIDSPFQQTSSLKPYVPTVILKKIIIDLEDDVVLSQVKFVSKTKNKSENDCQVIEKVCDSEENPNVIAPGMFKLSVSQSISPISVTKMSCASNGVESKLKRKRRKRTSSKQHDKQVNKDVLRANKAFVYFLDLDTLSGVRRHKPSGVMWMNKGSSNSVKADLSSDNHFNLIKNVKRYSRKNLMACNNSDTHNAFVCNNARNALCNARMSASVDVRDLFIFDDVSIIKSHVSKMPFRKKSSASLNVPSRSNLNKYLPRIMNKWLPKL